MRRFDKDLNEGHLLFEGTLNQFLSNSSDVRNKSELGEDWRLVIATQDGKVLIAAGNAGLGIYDPANSEVKYIERERKLARFVLLIDFEPLVAVAFEDKDQQNSIRWSIEFFQLMTQQNLHTCDYIHIKIITLIFRNRVP